MVKGKSTRAALARRQPNQLRKVVQQIRVLLRDIPGPDGRLWYGLDRNPIKLVWNISCEGEILNRGNVDEHGQITIKVRLPPKGTPLILRVGPPATEGPGLTSPESTPNEPEALFEWFEEFQLDQEEESYRAEIDVKGAQIRLNQLGYLAGLIDGSIGPIANAALTAFQEDMGLPVTGSLDQRTIDALGKTADQFNTDYDI